MYLLPLSANAEFTPETAFRAPVVSRKLLSGVPMIRTQIGAPAGGPITLAERAAAVRDGIETKTSSVT